VNTIEKIGLSIIIVAGVTTVLLPDRQTVAVGNVIGRWFNESLRTATGQRAR
jgi:hypothetical protein